MQNEDFVSEVSTLETRAREKLLILNGIQHFSIVLGEDVGSSLVAHLCRGGGNIEDTGCDGSTTPWLDYKD